MRKTLFCLFVFVSFQISAQKIHEFTSTQTPIGYTKNGKEIIANSLTFKHRVDNYYCNLNTLQLTVYLRAKNFNGFLKPKGRILFLDPSRQKTLWHKKALYTSNTYQQFGELFLHSNGTQLARLDANTGKTVWKSSLSLWYKDPFSPIGVCYPSASSYKNKFNIEGIDLFTGQRIWKRHVENTFGWNEVFQIEEQTLLIQSSGLHTVNTQNGKGWSYKTITGKKNHSRQVATALTGIALGALTGTYVYSYMGPDIISDVVSNVVSNEDFYFMSSLNEISCINNEGEIIWNKGLVEDESSSARLLLIDDILYHVNLGTAFKYGFNKPFGLPFIAAYNSKNGVQIYKINLEEEQTISDVKYHTDSTALVIFSDRVSLINLQDGTELNELILHSNFWGFLGEQNYLLNADSILTNIYAKDSSKLYLMNSNREVQILNSDLSHSGSIQLKDLYLLRGDYESLKLMEKNETIYLVNRQYQIVASFSNLSNTAIAGSVLYGSKDNNLIMLDLDPFLE